jgi:hypothetical protein
MNHKVISDRAPSRCRDDREQPGPKADVRVRQHPAGLLRSLTMYAAITATGNATRLKMKYPRKLCHDPPGGGDRLDRIGRNDDTDRLG